jgi:two-component system heavy metal sensor histidine kinase CusS
VRSIAARLAVWYALAATATTACLSVAGYFMLEKHLVHGLDLLNTSEFAQIKSRLGPDYRTLRPDSIDARIRETTEYSSVLFYIDIHGKGIGTLFRSTNLHGETIPDVPGERIFDADVPGIGPLRTGEFILPPFDVVVGTSLKPVESVMLGYMKVCIALVTMMLLVSIAIGFGLTHFALRPVRIIEETANRIRSDNLSERIPVDDIDDEVANLAHLLNQMFDRLESSFNQIRRFTADASHELKTPLSLMRLQAERMIVDGGLSAAQEEAVHVQLEEVTRLNEIIDELLFLSRAEARAIPIVRESQQPGVFILGFATDARVLAEHRGVRYRDSHEGEGTVAFDPKWIRQVLLNLLTNALHASPANSAVTVRSVLTDQMWIVSVEDEGLGVPAELRAKIFERFVRLPSPTGTETAGSGLGLAICQSMVQLHDGRIRAEAGANGRGLRVVFELPAESPSVAPSAPFAPASQATTRATARPEPETV